MGNFDSLATDVDIATIVNRCGKTKFDELDVHNAGQIEGDSLEVLVAHILAQLARPGVSSEMVVKDAVRAIELGGGSNRKMAFDDIQQLFDLIGFQQQQNLQQGLNGS